MFRNLYIHIKKQLNIEILKYITYDMERKLIKFNIRKFSYRGNKVLKLIFK